MFRCLIKEAETTSDQQRKIEMYKAAVELFDGPYLPNVDRGWAIMERENLERMYVLAGRALVKLYLQHREYESAINLCQRVLSERPFLEGIHRQAMRVYAAIGDRSAIVHQFKHCQTSINNELNLPVSKQTKDLFGVLMA